MGSGDDDQLPAAAAGPPRRLVGDVRNELAPMGEVQAIGRFAHGLGARRLEIAILVCGGALLIRALVAALS